ncbi:hypothetical protein [Terricaulis sp.]|uniref:hypothetical protein n=1 Tax=Terricaulis sp. TaxID=2768686 RepID=UPI003783696F
MLGIGDEPGQTIGYGVWIEELSRLVCFEAGELQGTGEIADRSQFYDDDSSSRVRVRVIDGKGFVVG